MPMLAFAGMIIIATVIVGIIYLFYRVSTSYYV